MEKFAIRSQPCFHNFTGLFSMGHKDSEALWMAGGYNSATGEYGQRKSCLCSYLHHSILSKVWPQDHPIGNYFTTTIIAEPKGFTLLTPKPNTGHKPELLASTLIYSVLSQPISLPRSNTSNSSISFSISQVDIKLHLLLLQLKNLDVYKILQTILSGWHTVYFLSLAVHLWAPFSTPVW
jgi:hypothetical protein